MFVKIWLREPVFITLQYTNVYHTYEKDDFYCIRITNDDGSDSVIRHRMSSILRIEERRSCDNGEAA